MSQCPLGFQGQHRHPLGGAGALGHQHFRVHDERSSLGGEHGDLPFSTQVQDAFQGAFVAVRTGELFPAGDGLIFVQGNASSLAILKEEEQVAAVVAGQTSPQDVLPRLHGQFRGQIFPQQAGLAIRTVGEPQLIALLPVGEHHQLISVVGLPLHEPSVPLFVLLFPRHPQGLRGDLFQIPFLGQE